MIRPGLLARIEQKRNQLASIQPNPPGLFSPSREGLVVEWIYNSNAIEGISFSLFETRRILAGGAISQGTTPKKPLEILNHRAAIRYVEDLAHSNLPVSPFHVRQAHALLMEGIDLEAAGAYRQTPVRISGAIHVPPPAWQVPHLMSDWCGWLSTHEQIDHPILLAARAHYNLAAIHPFIDGNGRIGRLMMNLVLIRCGYPPAIILKTHRRQYYHVLNQADTGRFDPLEDMVAAAVDSSLARILDNLKKQSLD